MLFMELVERAQLNELKEEDKRREEERKQSEALRLQSNPGTMNIRNLMTEHPDPETKLLNQLDADAAASRKAEKEAKDADEERLRGPFPPPPDGQGGTF